MAERPITVFAMDPANLPGLFPADLIRRLGKVARLDPALCVEDFANARYTPMRSRGRDVLQDRKSTRLNSSH